MTRSLHDRVMYDRASEQVREAVLQLHYASDGFYEDTAQVALDALDWIDSCWRFYADTQENERLREENRALREWIEDARGRLNHGAEFGETDAVQAWCNLVSRDLLMSHDFPSLSGASSPLTAT